MISVVQDLLFPPICVVCKEKSHHSYLCQLCWEQSSLLNPAERCPHCFTAIDAAYQLCGRCEHEPFLLFPRAALFDQEAPICRLVGRDELIDSFASFAFVQWERLGWPLPDLVIPIPFGPSEIARAFAAKIERPCIQLLRRKAWPIGIEQWLVQRDWVEEEQIMLLLDIGCTWKK